MKTSSVAFISNTRVLSGKWMNFSIAGNLRNYIEYSRIGFINILAFRLRYYTGIVTYLINVTVYYFIWKALYANNSDFAQGYTFEDMITYVAVGWMIRSVYFNNIDHNMAADVLEGKIALSLLKPVSIQTVYLGRALGEAAFRLILLTVPSAIVISLIFPVQMPYGNAWTVAFVLSLPLSVLIMAGINFIVGCFAIRMKSILGLLRAKFYVQELLSGLLLPMTMIPEPAKSIVTYLPFQHVAYTPLRIYLGKVDASELVGILFLQLFWVVTLMTFSRFLWIVLVRKLTIHGG